MFDQLFLDLQNTGTNLDLIWQMMTLLSFPDFLWYQLTTSWPIERKNLRIYFALLLSVMFSDKHNVDEAIIVLFQGYKNDVINKAIHLNLEDKR